MAFRPMRSERSEIPHNPILVHDSLVLQGHSHNLKDNFTASFTPKLYEGGMWACPFRLRYSILCKDFVSTTGIRSFMVAELDFKWFDRFLNRSKAVGQFPCTNAVVPDAGDEL